jgi:hypothetical protein
VKAEVKTILAKSVFRKPQASSVRRAMM